MLKIITGSVFGPANLAVTMKNLLVIGLSFLLALGCRDQNRLIRSPDRLADITRMLEVQKRITAGSQVPIWDILDGHLSRNEEQAMEFLYAYMPLSDLADYPPSFFLANVQQSLRARKEMPWSERIPEDIYLHFVLPLRVNNENLDSFRLVMYDEIRSRIKGLGMTEAALEINHWCHEKVNYRGTDIRTSAPLCTMKKTFGRCGEESTFTVAAMRTAGIPARQVYTPRWAHVDDNHAWVEVWIEGTWHYLGACEPEPRLDLGWFSEPSRRSMLIHTRAYGPYFGEEEVITGADRFSELNLTSRYAPVKTITVIAGDKDHRPADSAKIEFGLYNYAEFYPIAVKYTDSKGTTSLTCGLGSLLVWASHDGWFGYRFISVAETDTLRLTLGRKGMTPHTENCDLVPPHATRADISVTEEQRRTNIRRLVLEDSIRNAYAGTFKDSAWARSLAQRLGLDKDTVTGIIAKAYGNWTEIEAYLEKNSTAYRNSVCALIQGLSDKDLSDAREEILTDHLRNAIHSDEIDRKTFEKWVLPPRIANENLSPWRGFLNNRLVDMQDRVQKDILVLIRWIQENITLNTSANLHSRAPLTPVGVYNLRVADSQSRDIFFVAACRTLGIPARINPVTRMAEYFSGGSWHQAGFGQGSGTGITGYLELTRSHGPVIPQYYTHFTLARLAGGSFKTLEYDEGLNLSDFPSPTTLDTGQYMLVTGNRIGDGTVLGSLTFFSIRRDERVRIPVALRVLPGCR